jgi:DNA mismatch endonuclease (patch repair protein)
MSMLEEEGWRIAVIWECAMRGKRKMDFSDMMDRLTNWIESEGKTLMLKGK